MKDQIAIVGMACRFPSGGEDLQKFWYMLQNQVDGISTVPKDRWDKRRYFSADPQKPGKCYVNQAGFLNSPIDEFDSLFFGISPREAECMDPQQRLLLELTWEAFEDAGLQHKISAGSNMGVFIGGFCLDNKLLQLDRTNHHLIDSNTPTSSTMAILANRISYIFNLRGPSVTIDTACSSSLVATHLACQSLWNRESEIAIAGGVNIMLKPEYSITMSKGHFLSQHGRCKAFDKDAAGYVRGEGGGIVILKPLQQAIVDGDFVYALIRETGINQDGRTAGIAFPNGNAQEKLIQDVYQRAKISHREISYVEAHGTGTQAGDVAELTALHNVLKERENKCYVGSVKTNIGHLEAGAGIAGLIKTSLCLHHKKITPNLHFNNPNPKISFSDICLTIPEQFMDWKVSLAKRMASVNSFGYGGTNAHVLLEEYGVNKNTLTNPNKKHFIFFPLSAHSKNALQSLADRYRNYLRQSQNTFTDIIYCCWKKRTHLHQRLAILANSEQEVIEKLDIYCKGQIDDQIITGIASKNSPRIIAVFTGMGPQRAEMGYLLYTREPIFRQYADQCEKVFQEISGTSILAEIFKAKDKSRILDTDIAQPANLIIQIALIELIKSRGISIAAAIGHSVGEIAAAYTAGVINLKEAITISYYRSQLQKELAGSGTMLAVNQTEEYLQKMIVSEPGIDIAAINSHSSTTLSGTTESLKKIAATLDHEKIFNRILTVEVPYHSHKMEQIKERFLAALDFLNPKNNCIPLYSTVTGTKLSGKYWGAEYWWKNICETVQFAQSCYNILEDDFNQFLEVGPHPVLKNYIVECASTLKKEITLLHTLHRNFPDDQRFEICIAQIYTQIGIEDIDQYLGFQGNHVKLPTYPWQKVKCWRESTMSKEYRLGSNRHPFLAIDLQMPQPTWEVELNPLYFPYLRDHQVQGHTVFPGAAFVEAGLAIATENSKNKKNDCFIQDIEFSQMLIEHEKDTQLIQSQYNEYSKRFSIFSAKAEDQKNWQLHATGKIIDDEFSLSSSYDFTTIRSICCDTVVVEQLYHTLSQKSLVYKKHFRTIHELYSGKSEMFVFLRAYEPQLCEQSIAYPPVLDGAFQALITILPTAKKANPFVPVSIKKLKLKGKLPAECWCYGKIINISRESFTANLYFFNDKEQCIAEVLELKCREIIDIKTNTLSGADFLYEYQWLSQPLNFNSDWQKRLQVVACAEDHQSLNQVVELLKRKQFGVSGLLYVDDSFKEKLVDKFTTVVYIVPNNGKAELKSFIEIIEPLLNIVKHLQKYDDGVFQLIILTEQTLSVMNSDSPSNFRAMLIWQLGQLIENEYPNITCKTIDVCSISQNTIWPQELAAGNDSDIAYRKEQRFVRKLNHLSMLDQTDEKKQTLFHNQALTLEIEQPGNLDSLIFQEKVRIAPKSQEIEIKVLSSALNFKDLLKAYGQITEEVTENTYFGDTLGMELCGEVISKGCEVTDFNIGDTVILPIPGSFSSYATVPTTYVIHKPKNVDVDKAPIIIGYLTAYRGLVDIADLCAGEKILIHNATGGVGLAAIQIAKWKNAQIYATVGTKEKIDYLKELGIEYIYNSRSLSFADEILRDTKGYGVDVIISAMSGNAILHNFDILAPYGRYIEIGKKDISKNSPLPSKPFNQNITFASVDIDRMLAQKPKMVQRLLHNISEKFAQNIFFPIPVHMFHTNQIADAFRFMSQGKHIGKVIVSFQENTKVTFASDKTKFSLIDDNATYLITGGTRGFGLTTARWLVEQGARNLILISRSAKVENKGLEDIAQLKSKGVNLCIRAVDISEQKQLDKLAAELHQTFPPVKGIIHSAAVFDDGLMVDMNNNRFAQVIAPKVMGAINLSQSFKNSPLDFFVMFSSISSIVGNPGQANYIAANGFLDAFSFYLRKQNIPAITINWGVFSETGLVARNLQMANSLAQLGIKGFSNYEALCGLELALKHNCAQVGYFNVDWDQWWLSSTRKNAGRLSKLVGSTSKVNNAELIEKLLTLTNEKRTEYMQNLIKQQIAKVLKCDEQTLHNSRKVTDLGIDSLMAVELAFQIKKETGVEITVIELLDGPSISMLASRIVGVLVTEIDEMIANIDQLSEEQLDELLDSELTKEI